jgi:hypothetical protein
MSVLTTNGSKFQKPLGLELKDPQTGKVFDKHELIDVNDSKTKRTLAGLLHFDKENGLSIVGDDGKPVLTYTNGENWSLVPGFLTHLARKVSAVQREDLGADRENLDIQIYGYENGKRTNEAKAKLHAGTWFAEGILKTDGEFDSSLLNMFDLIFHGTTQDIHDKNNRFQLEDALFKDGFYIDPDAARSRNGNDTNTVPIGNAEDSAIFLEIGTPDNFFTIDIDTRAAGIGINIRKLATHGTTKESKPKTPDETLTEEQQFLNTLDDFTRDKLVWYKNEVDDEIELNDAALQVVVDHENDTSVPGFINAMINKMDDEYLDKICYFKLDGRVIKRFSAREFINQQLADLGNTEGYQKYAVKDYKGKQRLFINDDYVFVNGKLIKAVEETSQAEEIAKANTGEPKRMFATKAIPKLISYIKSGYPSEIFEEDDEYKVGETVYTRDQYDKAAQTLINLINTNNKKSADTLRNAIAKHLEDNPILIGLNQAINNAKC